MALRKPTSDFTEANTILYSTVCAEEASLAHTYIHNWPLQPFSHDYGLASHTTYVCVNFIREWRDLQFNVDFARQIFWETFSWQVYLLRVFARNLLRNWQKSPKKYFFSYFVLMPDLRHQPELYVYILSYIRQLQRPMISNYNRHSHFRIYESKWLKFICCVPE